MSDVKLSLQDEKLAGEVVFKLESLSGWSGYRERTTSGGPMLVKAREMCATAWDVRNNKRLWLLAMMKGYSVHEPGNGKRYLCHIRHPMSTAAKERLIEESKAADTDAVLMVPPGKSYYPFQRAGIRICTNRLFGQEGFQERDAVLIGDGMGLGKTIQAIGILNQDPNLRTLRALVVCPASLKLNWRNEMRQFLLDGIGNEVVVVKNKWPGALLQPRLAIVNYDVLHKYEREIRLSKWDYLIFDEAHYLKNESTRWTVYALGGLYQDKAVGRIEAHKTVFLTGTPIPNRVEEVWPIVKVCDPRGLGARWDAFRNRYCKSKENLLELQERMRTTFMVRRLKEQVFSDFPEKIRKVFSIDPDECHGLDKNLFKQEMSIFKEYQELLQTWALKIELAKADSAEEYLRTVKTKRQSLGMKASELAKMRMRTAIAKAPAVAQRVIELAEGGEKKIVVFAFHHEVMDLIQAHLKKAGLTSCILDGRVAKVEDRQAMVDAFQRGEIDVFIGGFRPAGVGWTLTRGTICVFAELDYVPGNLTQCEDREHRIGQKNAVYVEHDVLEGSLDEFMAGHLVEKQDTIARALDWDEDADDEETADGMMQKERAATQGVSGKKIQEEGLRMSQDMETAAKGFCEWLLDHGMILDIDRQVLEGLFKQGYSRNRSALFRRVALRYKEQLSFGAKALEWPKTAPAGSR